MTSSAKGNHWRVEQLFEQAAWFGRWAGAGPRRAPLPAAAAARSAVPPACRLRLAGRRRQVLRTLKRPAAPTLPTCLALHPSCLAHNPPPASTPRVWCAGASRASASSSSRSCPWCRRQTAAGCWSSRSRCGRRQPGQERRAGRRRMGWRGQGGAGGQEAGRSARVPGAGGMHGFPPSPPAAASHCCVCMCVCVRVCVCVCARR